MDQCNVSGAQRSGSGVDDATLSARELAALEAIIKNSRTGISFDWVPSVEGEPSGFRFMRHHHIGEPCKSLCAAIKKAIGGSAK